MRRTVVLAGYYGFGNTGDEAILASILAGLRRRVPGTVFIVVSGDPEATRRQHTVEAIGWRDLPALSASVAKSDAVLVGGGGLFQDYWGLDVKTLLTPQHGEIAFYAGPVVLAALARKPALLYGLGFGPLSSPEARRYARAVADAAVHISVRDEASRELLLATGVPEARIHSSADPAFALEIPENAPGPADLCRASGVEPRAPILGVALRPWSIGVEQPAWEKEVVGALEGFLAQTGGTILFVPFEKSPWTDKDDFEQASRLAAALSGQGRVVVAPIADDRQPREVAALLAGCDLVLGMRLHSLVFAAAGGVPGVGLAYDPKVTALLSRLGGPAALPLAKATSRSLLDALTRSIAERAGTSARLRAAAAKQKALAEDDLDRAARLIAEPPPAPEVSRAVLSLFDDALEANRGRASEIEASLSAARGGLEALERAHAREKALLEQRLGETRQELARLQGSRLWRLANLYARLRRSAAAFARRILGRPASDWAGPDTSAGAARRAVPMRDESRYDVVWLGRGPEASLPERSRAILAAYAKAGHRVFPVRPEDVGGLDALRRADALAATAVFVEDPAGLPHARRMRSSRGWLLVDATGEPDHSAEPPDVVLDPAASPEDVLQAIPGFFPKASIVVVTRENRDLNRLCLESVRARTEWPNFEVLVVDNGSSDGTVELLRELARGWPRLSVIENAENRGFAAAVNQGFAAAGTTRRRPLPGHPQQRHGRDPGLAHGPSGAPARATPSSVWSGRSRTPSRTKPRWTSATGGSRSCRRRRRSGCSPTTGKASRSRCSLCSARRSAGRPGRPSGRSTSASEPGCSRTTTGAAAPGPRAGRSAAPATPTSITGRRPPSASSAKRPISRCSRRTGASTRRSGEATRRRPRPGRPRRADLGKYRSQLAALLESRTEAVAAKGRRLSPVGRLGHPSLPEAAPPRARVRPRRVARDLRLLERAGPGRRLQGDRAQSLSLRGPAGVLEQHSGAVSLGFPVQLSPDPGGSPPTRPSSTTGSTISRSFPTTGPCSRRTTRARFRRDRRRGRGPAAPRAGARRRPDALYLPNGVEYERFAARGAGARPTTGSSRASCASGRPIAGYYGALAEWFDYEMLDEVARAPSRLELPADRADVRPEPAGRPMSSARTFGGSALATTTRCPDICRLFDVATIPFRINPITRRPRR